MKLPGAGCHATELHGARQRTARRRSSLAPRFVAMSRSSGDPDPLAAAAVIRQALLLPFCSSLLVGVSIAAAADDHSSDSWVELASGAKVSTAEWGAAAPAASGRQRRAAPPANGDNATVFFSGAYQDNLVAATSATASAARERGYGEVPPETTVYLPTQQSA